MSNSPENKPHAAEYFTANRIVDWLSQYGKNLIYGLIGVLALLIIIYQFTNRDSAKSEGDFIQAASDFTLFTRQAADPNAANAITALNGLKELMARHQELHAAYDGVLGQILLDQAKVSEAKPYINSTLLRTKPNDLPFYADYAKASLLISEEHFQEALNLSMALQQQMVDALNQGPSKEHSFGGELLAFNLLRLAMLNQKLGLSQAELKAWQEWKQYAGIESGASLLPNIDAGIFRLIIQQLAIGTFTLPDYISYREKALIQ